MGRKWLALALCLVGSSTAWAQGETSSGDKLRILYSNRLTFTQNGTPLVTVEIMSGQKEIRVSARGGLKVLPDGEGGAEMTGASEWRITSENTQPAKLREWVIVERFHSDHDARIDASLAVWKGRGYAPRTFEVGTVFGTGGEVIDTREVLIAVSPGAPGSAAKKARAIARKYHVTAETHEELLARPTGKIVARSGSTVIENPAVLWFAPQDESRTLTVHDVVTGHGGSQLSSKRQTRSYFGSVYITLGSDGKLTAVNAVPETKLLAGLVPSEMFPSAHENALAAQTIAARTELLEKVGRRHLGDPYLLCSNQHCQVYSGAGKEHPRTTRAVERTRGMVLARKGGGGLVDARYSAACGGHSEHKENIWGGTPDPVLRGHVDASPNSRFQKSYKNGVTEESLRSFLADKKGGHCAHTRFSKNRYRWTKKVSRQELSSLVAKHYPEVGSVRALTPRKRGISGRISALEIQGSRRTIVARGDLHIRRMLGGLRSSLFLVEASDDGFHFTGAGFGHGVGMCQLGAMSMAEQGSTFSDILRHYYPRSLVQRLY